MDARTCYQCGESYAPVVRNQKFCTPKCSQRYFGTARNDQRREQRAAERSEQPCAECGQMFTPFGTQTICSKRCRLVRNNRRVHAWWDAVRAERGDYTPPPPERLACHGCARFAPCEGSETGGQCVAGVFRSCQPFSAAPKFYQPKEARA